MNQLLRLGFFGLIVMSMVGCGLRDDLNDIQAVTLQPEMAIPMLNTRFTVETLLNQLSQAQRDQIDTTTGGLLRVRYDTDLYTTTVGDLLTMEDVEAAVSDTTTRLPFSAFGGGSVTRANLKSGVFRYEVGVALPGSYRMDIEMPDAERQGQVFRVSRFFQGGGTIQGVDSLAGYVLNMPDGILTFSAQVIHTATNLPVTAQTFNVSLEEVAFSYIEGNFSDYTLGSDTTSIDTDVLGTFNQQPIAVAQPLIRLVADNAIGVPLRIRFDQFDAVAEDGSTLGLTHTDLSTGVDLNFPTIDEVGQSDTTAIIIDYNNSNLVDLAALFPTQLALGWTLDIGQGQPGERYFISEESELSFHTETEIPLYVRTQELQYRDTFVVDASWPETEQVEFVEFKVVTESGIPFEAGLQIFFLDSARMLVDSLFSGASTILAGAPVDTDGVPTGVERMEQFVGLSQTRYATIQTSEYIAYRLDMATNDGGSTYVQFFEDQGVDIKLGLRAQLQAAPDSLSFTD